MLPIFPIASSLTVNTLIAEVYDLVKPSTGAIDPARRDAIAQGLRTINPTLPADETPINPANLSWIWLLPSGRADWRIPASPGALRDDLATLHLRNIRQLLLVSVDHLMENLPGTPTQTSVERIRNLASLMRLPGINRTIAEALHDAAQNPVKTPEELVALDQATLKGKLEAMGLPQAFLDKKPWFLFQYRAKTLIVRPQRGFLMRRPIPVAPAKAEERVRFWEEQAASPRSAAERESAETVRWLYQIQSRILRGNQALYRKNREEAYRELLGAYQEMGRQALQEGLISAGSPEESGPSVETVLGVCQKLLSRLQPADLSAARSRGGLSTVPRFGGLASFQLQDLQTSHQDTVQNALDSHRVFEVGKVSAQSLEQGMEDRSFNQLSTNLQAGLTTPNVNARVLDFGVKDREQVLQNLRSETFQNLRTQMGSLYSGFTAKAKLGDLKSAVGTALDVSGVTPTAATVLDSSVASEFPSTLLGNMGPFDTFVGFTPSRKNGASTYYVPVNSNFAARYRLDVLAPMLAEEDAAVWNYSVEDFTDPARFAAILPQLFARHLPMALSDLYLQMGRTEIAVGVLSGGVVRSSMLNNPVNTDLRQTLSTGTTGSASGVSCEDMIPFLASLRALNQSGDAAYQAGNSSATYRFYTRVLEAASACEEFAEYVSALEAIHEDLTEQTGMVGASTVLDTSVSMLNYIYRDTTTEVCAPVFSGVLRQADPVRMTATTAAMTQRTPMFYSMSIELGDEWLLEFETATGSWGGVGCGPPVEDDEEEMWLPLLPEGNISYCPGSTVESEGVLPATLRAKIETEILHAFTYRQQLAQGFNWLGFDPEMIPIWSFDYLLGQARYFAEKADSLQQRALNALEAAETHQEQFLQAVAQAALAVQGVKVAQAQEAVASASQIAAIESLQAANAAVESSKDDNLWAWIGVAGAALLTIGATALTAGVLGAPILAFGIAAAKEMARSGGASMLSQIPQVDRADDEQSAAAEQQDVATANLEVAKAQVVLANEQAALAELEAQYAAQYLEYLTTQELNTDAWYELASVVGDFASAYLLMANRLAWLAERAYQWETRRYSSMIAMNYDDPQSTSGRFASAAALLSDLDALAHTRITSTTNRYQVIKASYSLSLYSPSALLSLIQTGSALFQIRQKDLDLRYPGLYLHSLKSVEIRFDGLLPAQGVHAVLRTVNQSTVRVPYDSEYAPEAGAVESDWAYPAEDYPLLGDSKPPYVIKPLYGQGFAQILSEYSRAADHVVLAPPAGALDCFEHLGMDAMWLLELPRSANGFDRAHLADVRVDLYFTAHYDSSLAAQQQTALAEGERLTQALLLLATTHAAESWAEWVGETSPASGVARLLRLEVTKADLPQNLQDAVIDNFMVVFTGLGETSLNARFAFSKAPFGQHANTTLSADDAPDGMVYTAYGDEDVYDAENNLLHASRQGDFPGLEGLLVGLRDGSNSANFNNLLGTWVIKALLADNTSLAERADNGDTVQVNDGEIQLSNNGSAVYTDGDWRHAEASVWVSLADNGTFALSLRDGSGSAVTATLGGTLSGSDSVLTLGLSLQGGASATPLVSAAHNRDPWYQLTLRVLGTTASVLLDGIEVLSLSWSGVAGSGTVKMAWSGTNPAAVSEVSVRELRYTGEGMEVVVKETFAESSDWSLTNAVRADVSRSRLDLSAISEVMLQIDYTCAIDFEEA